MRFIYKRASLVAVWLVVLLAVPPNIAFAQSGDADSLLDKAIADLNLGPEAAKDTLERLTKIESTFSAEQRARYFRILVASYAFRGLYSEQVAASKRALEVAKNDDQRAILLYYVADGFTNLGQYDKALQAMNESILLLPKLVEQEAKVDVLQSAVTLLESLRAYDESAVYAERLASLPSNGNAIPACLGLGDLVELAYLQHDSKRARSLLPDVIKLCDDGGHKIIALSILALDLVDRLGNGGDAKELQDSLVLLAELTKKNERSDYSIQLANAIAKWYLSKGQVANAESYGMRALQWANVGNAIVLRQQTNETMAAIMRVQGRFESALGYLDVSRDLWSKLLEERSRKDIAYQRVKFQTQDQSVQLKLLGQINKLLTSERELQDRNQYILQFLVLTVALLLVGALAWLFHTWRQKNNYRAFSQIDGLTKVSNRAHLINCAAEAFKSARGCIAVIIFDMDEFKQINDNFSHATGDWVLKTVSATISACLRANDLFGRLGGEEFSICLPGTSEDEATVLAERCRTAIAAIDSTPSGLDFTISASFGVAVRPAQSMVSFEETLARADQALYRAKRLGRNQVAIYNATFKEGSEVPQPA